MLKPCHFCGHTSIEECEVANCFCPCAPSIQQLAKVSFPETVQELEAVDPVLAALFAGWDREAGDQDALDDRLTEF